MWLTVPKDLDNVLWQGPLEPATEEAVERLSRKWASRGVEADVGDAIRDLPAISIGQPEPATEEAVERPGRAGASRGVEADVGHAIRDMPVISIGQPEVWPLAKVYPPEKMPPTLQAKQAEADFYLVRLACSFRPAREDVKIEWARFLVHLLPESASRVTVAFDVHPLQITQEVRHNVKVTLSPTLKFMEVEAGVGGVEFGLEYPELQPLVTAAGAGEANPSWDYEEAQGVRIQGSRWMHLLVKAPKGMLAGQAVLDLAANVRVRGSLLHLQVPRRREELAHLTAQLWG